MMRHSLPLRLLSFVAVAVGFACLTGNLHGQPPKRPFQIEIEKGETKIENAAAVLPINRKINIRLNSSGNSSWGMTTLDGKRLTFSSGSGRANVRIDGRAMNTYNSRRVALPPGPRGKARSGYKYLWQSGNIHMEQTQEIILGRPLGKPKPGQQRTMDVVLFKYVLHNKGAQAAKVGLRVRIDMYNWTTDGPGFIAPTMPKRILDGVLLKGKQVPDYIVSIQNRSLQNPGHKAIFTLNMGRSWEKPEKLAPTSHGAGEINQWDVRVFPGGGDTDIVCWWAEKKLLPGKKRTIYFAYGTSLATNPEGMGRVNVALEGSFEPKRRFNVTAIVDDPAEGQSLRLELPPGMKLLDEDETQPVPLPNEENRSVVVWNARVVRPGRHVIRVHSSNGVTKSRIVTVTATK